MEQKHSNDSQCIPVSEETNLKNGERDCYAKFNKTNRRFYDSKGLQFTLPLSTILNRRCLCKEDKIKPCDS